MKTFLIADDIFTNQFLLEAILTDDLKLDCNCRMVQNGKAALDVLKSEKVDMVFMDIEMPIMNGLEATSIIKANDSPYKNIPVIALTAHNLEEFKEMFGNTPFDSILEKPYSVERITELLTEFNFV